MEMKQKMADNQVCQKVKLLQREMKKEKVFFYFNYFNLKLQITITSMQFWNLKIKGRQLRPRIKKLKMILELKKCWHKRRLMRKRQASDEVLYFKNNILIDKKL